MKTRRIGILFYFRQDEDVWILLGERRRPLVWDIPSDEIPEPNMDLWLAAIDISRETLGGMPPDFERRSSITTPIGLLGPLRTVFAVELPGHPEFGTFGNIDHHEESHTFRRCSWHLLHQLPVTIHWTLVPVLWHLWLTQSRGKVPRRRPKPWEVSNRRGRAFRSKVCGTLNRLFGKA